ncbi:uncharacterized protein LTR77_005421 [Saxophila tyrrhenica]|uniref:Uncharacterized protein n=1 Tax=Saxophila tyrrhenica TaxID=1690608 RepID=A0AAV9PCL0_9PEZI|nr:hypothetical protein LTR77_005421 [Saxophila tyrrhenica]
MVEVFGSMDKVQANDEDTQGSGSGSGYSDLSALENETDDFGRRLIQHQRDAARLKALSGSQQAFRKARPKPRIADVLAREERENRLREAQVHNRTGSGGSHDSDPPVTVPREWGRKARKQTDWMRKILEPSEPSENGDAVLNGHDGEIFTRRTAFTGDSNWRPRSDGAVQDVRHTPAAREHAPSTPPSSMRHMNTTLRHDVYSESHDFSSASLLTSTPATNRLSRKVDELARRELEDLEGQDMIADVTNEMTRPATDRNLHRSSGSTLRDRTKADDTLPGNSVSSRPATALGHSANASRIPRRQRSPDRNQENIPPSGESNGTVAGHKRTEAETLVNRTAQQLTTRNAQRPGHSRNDSMNLLKKLARVSSMSPSPANDKQKDVIADEKTSSDGANTLALRPKSANDAATAPQTSARSRRSEPQAIRIGRQVDGEDGEATAGNSGQAAIVSQEMSTEPKTPVVTGAWVDTTMHAGDEASKATAIFRPRAIAEAELRRTSSEPSHQRSALGDILRESKEEQRLQGYGESTIQSLQDIVDPNLEPTDPTITSELDVEVKDEEVGDDRLMTQDEKDRRQESLAIEGMNKHLRSARTNVKDANRGLRRVENRIEASQHTIQAAPPTAPSTAPPTAPPAAAAATTVIVHQQPGRFGFQPCDTCGGCYHSVWAALWDEFRSYFYTWDPNYRYRIRFTSLGLLCIASLLWYLLECWMCSLYSHPFVTSRKAYTPDPKAPRFPFVIPTLLFRPFFKWGLGEDTYDYVWQALEAWWHEEVFERFIAGGNPCYKVHPAMCGAQPVRLQQKTTVRSAFESVRPSRQEWVAAATATGARFVGSVVDAIDEAGSMWDDFEVDSV